MSYAPPPAPPDLRIRPGEWIKRQLTEAAVQMFMLSRHADHILLCAGDAAAVPLVRMVQREGVRVSVISSAANRPRLIADDLRRQADHFLEFRDWRGIFARTAD